MNTSSEFQEFPKIARFSRECIITEKIDGTNAQLLIEKMPEEAHAVDVLGAWNGLTIKAGSRTRWITPQNDNFGFARWAQEHGAELVALGEGHHYGEWWGQGIQRGYGLKEKRFSLFNVSRFVYPNQPKGEKQIHAPVCCHVVPTLAVVNFDAINETVEWVMQDLALKGSRASPGFMKPEGVVIYHVQGNVSFKKTLEKDEVPKTLQ